MLGVHSSVLVIFLMINESFSVHPKRANTTSELSQQLLNIFHETSPREEGHLERMKREWDRQQPEHSHEHPFELHRKAWLAIKRYRDEWKQRPENEKLEMEKLLRRIHDETDDGEPNHERRMLEKLLKYYPKYQNEFELMRTVVHRWYQHRTSRTGELHADNVYWTPELKADLLHIIDRVRSLKGDNIARRIKDRWSQIHSDQNLKATSLLRYAYKLNQEHYVPDEEEKNRARRKYDELFPAERKSTKDEGDSQKRKRIKWTKQNRANVLYIYDKIQDAEEPIRPLLKERWDKMCRRQKQLTEENLLKYVSIWKKKGYKPTEEEMMKAKEKYEKVQFIQLKGMKTPRESWKQVMREENEPSHQYQDLSTPSCRRNKKHDVLRGKQEQHQSIFSGISENNFTADHYISSHYERGETSRAPNPGGNDEYYEDEMRFSPLPYHDFHSTPDDYTSLQNSDIGMSHHTEHSHDSHANYHHVSSSNRQIDPNLYYYHSNHSDSSDHTHHPSQ